MTPEMAAEMARDALLWLAGTPEALGGLMAAGGLSIADVQNRSGDPEFLGFVMDYLLSSDEMILEFSRSSGVDPQTPQRVRAALPGGDVTNWT